MGTESEADARVKRQLCGAFNEDGTPPTPEPGADRVQLRRATADDRDGVETFRPTADELARLADDDEEIIESLRNMRGTMIAPPQPDAVETMIALELAAGNITVGQLQHFLQNRDALRAIRGRARDLLRANRPPQNPPPRPPAAAAGRPCEAERTWRIRRAQWDEAWRSWRARMQDCREQRRPEPPAGTADTPLVTLGPGGDYRRHLCPKDLDAAAGEMAAGG